jgi:hypothetical protein
MPDPAELIELFDSGRYRPQSFQGYCVENYGRTGAVKARLVIVSELLDRGLRVVEIAAQVGVSYVSVCRDKNVITTGSDYPSRQSHTKKNKKTVSDLAIERRQQRKELDGITDRNGERLYEAMRNAPQGAISLPMLNRATKVLEALGELTALDPKVAATQMPSVRCREYSGSRAIAQWWMDFADSCEQRRQLETPSLNHLHEFVVDKDNRIQRVDRWGKTDDDDEFPSLLAKVAMKHSPIERAVLDVLQTLGRAVTEAELGVSIATANIGNVLRNLADQGLIVDENGTYRDHG